jgi:hypothetical protein
VLSISQIAEPGLDTFAVEFFDTGVSIGGSGCSAGDGYPILSFCILECDLDLLIGIEVLEFLGMRIGEISGNVYG